MATTHTSGRFYPQRSSSSQHRHPQLPPRGVTLIVSLVTDIISYQNTRGGKNCLIWGIKLMDKHKLTSFCLFPVYMHFFCHVFHVINLKIPEFSFEWRVCLLIRKPGKRVEMLGSVLSPVFIRARSVFMCRSPDRVKISRQLKIR